MAEERGHLALLAAYGAVIGAGSELLRRRRGFSVPGPGDIALLGVAAFKASRLLTRERVTQPLREPFTEVAGDGPGSEVAVVPQGEGLRRAVGELLTCPFCASVWVATAGVLSFAGAPNATRLAASGLATMAAADVAQYAMAGVRRLEG